MSRRTMALMAALLVSLVGATEPALARPIAGGSATTKSDLEKKGYKCEVVSVGFEECTKSGSTTYWCDAGGCQPKPRIQTGGGLRDLRAPIGGLRFSR